MQQRAFGKTGLSASELVFGGGAVGGLLINQPPEVRLSTVQRALEAGINWIDTAPSYGDGRSESALGEIFADLETLPQVSTKVTIDTREGDISGQVERSLADSLERLGQSKVTLLQLHNPVGDKTSGRMLGLAEVMKTGGVLDALETMQHMGLTDHIGITALGEIPALTRVLKTNRVQSAQVYYNLLNPSAGFTVSPNWPCYNFTSLMDTCIEQGVAIMAIRIFSAGIIATTDRTGRERPLTQGDTVDSETAKATAMFAALGEDYGTRAQTAIRFALAQEKISCAVFGLAEPAHLEEAIAGAALGPLPEEALVRIHEVYQRGI